MPLPLSNGSSLSCRVRWPISVTFPAALSVFAWSLLALSAAEAKTGSAEAQPAAQEPAPAVAAVDASVAEGRLTEETPRASDSITADAEPGGTAANTALAAKQPLPANPEKPRVALSDGHQKTCRKLVGDKIAPLKVVDFKGDSHSFLDLLSDQLTVLVFWNETSLLAREQFRRIPVEVLGTFASYRVKVIAVNVQGDAETTKILTGNAADKIVSLVDANAEFFHHLADSRVPRTYILDKDGHILWFDVEYSQSMVRSMENALAYFLTTRE